MNDVGLLRQAAKKMRERAEAANTDDARRPYGMKVPPVPQAEWGALVDNYLGGEIGQHCASWHPAVALAVADWLDCAAAVFNADLLVLGEDFHPPTHRCAVSVARAYLRGGS